MTALEERPGSGSEHHCPRCNSTSHDKYILPYGPHGHNNWLRCTTCGLWQDRDDGYWYIDPEDEYRYGGDEEL